MNSVAATAGSDCSTIGGTIGGTPSRRASASNGSPSRMLVAPRRRSSIASVRHAWWRSASGARASRASATRVSDARLARAPDALRHHACRTLAIELRRLGATNIRLGDPFDALARRLGVPPIVPPIVEQSDPAVAATLFIDYHDLIEDGLARGTPGDVAHTLAITAPMP